MKTMTIPAKIDYMDELLDMVDAYLEEFSCSMKTMYQVRVSVEELITNIASYAYEDDEGLIEVSCRVETEEEESTVWICIRDNGKPYNPLERPDPDFDIPFEERGIGGLGIYMVKVFMDYMEYQYLDGYNQFTIGKKL